MRACLSQSKLNRFEPGGRDLCDPAVIVYVQKFLQRALDLAVAVLADDEYYVLLEQVSVILSDDQPFYLSNFDLSVCHSSGLHKGLLFLVCAVQCLETHKGLLFLVCAVQCLETRFVNV